MSDRLRNLYTENAHGRLRSDLDDVLRFLNAMVPNNEVPPLSLEEGPLAERSERFWADYLTELPSPLTRDVVKTGLLTYHEVLTTLSDEIPTTSWLMLIVTAERFYQELAKLGYDEYDPEAPA